ncbi:uncharacterized protein ACOB7L_019631 isoform 1-T1 [Callospermophilus lateralis]|uniref:uncharacterized protein LOC143405080 n=1 Tax=Callospermophilus lateralis TaxID=76772 RepID=UPI0040546578
MGDKLLLHWLLAPWPHPACVVIGNTPGPDLELETDVLCLISGVPRSHLGLGRSAGAHLASCQDHVPAAGLFLRGGAPRRPGPRGLSQNTAAGHVTFGPGAPRDPWAVTVPQTPPDVLGVCITLGSCPHLALSPVTWQIWAWQTARGRAALLLKSHAGASLLGHLDGLAEGRGQASPFESDSGADARCHLLPHPLSCPPLVSGVLICRWLHLSVSTARGRLGGTRTRPLCFLLSRVFILGSSCAISPAGHFPALTSLALHGPDIRMGGGESQPSGCRPGAWLLNTAGCPVVSFLVPEPYWMLMPQPSATTRTSS